MKKVAMKNYYVFYYRAPGGPTAAGNRGWKHPNSYSGPFATRAGAQDNLSAEMSEWRQSMQNDFGSFTKKDDLEHRNHFRIRRLTDGEFKKMWGALPIGALDSSAGRFASASPKRVSAEVNELMRKTRPTAKAHPKNKKKKNKKGFLARLFS